MYCRRDAEANDMIHMGSDHRSVLAHFVIAAPKKEHSESRWRKNEIRLSNQVRRALRQTTKKNQA